MVSAYSKLHAVIGLTLVVLSVFLVAVTPPNIAPEFSGMTVMHLSFDTVQAEDAVVSALQSFEHEVSIEAGSGSEYTLTTQPLDDVEYVALKNAIMDGVGPYTVLQYQSFSPSISQELVRKALIALVIGMVIIVLYISFVFRGVSRPVASWRYGVVAIFALLHDVLIPLGFFALIASFSSAAVDALFVTALLATLGYSINDTIVVFDRVRERLYLNGARNRKESFAKTIDYGTRQSVRRSVYTSASTLIPLALLCVFVPVTKWFALALFVGVLAGTYSSLFFAPSLLLLWSRVTRPRDQKKRERTDTERAEEELRNMLAGDDTI